MRVVFRASGKGSFKKIISKAIVAPNIHITYISLRFVNNDLLLDVVKTQFNMTIHVPKLIKDLDRDGDGKLSYEEFAALFSN